MLLAMRRRLYVTLFIFLLSEDDYEFVNCKRKVTQTQSVLTCRERGRQRVHLLVHHLLVQSSETEGLHGEWKRPGQHRIHVHATGKSDKRNER